MKQPNVYSIFTKPWKEKNADELGRMVNDLGFNGIEYPLRPGYQVDINNPKAGLKEFTKVLASHGVSVTSVASSTEESVFEACAESGVPLIRIMYGADMVNGYMKCESSMKKDIERFLPFCRQYDVKVGIQHHYGNMVCNSMEMRHLLEDYDPGCVGAIWDAAHSGLAGEEPEQALDIVWDHLVLVNFKAALYRLKTGPEAGEALYERYFTTGRNGLCSWRRAIKYLCDHGYSGIVCLPAEYNDEANVEAYAREDLVYAKQLFSEYCK